MVEEFMPYASLFANLLYHQFRFVAFDQFLVFGMKTKKDVLDRRCCIFIEKGFYSFISMVRMDGDVVPKNAA